MSERLKLGVYLMWGGAIAIAVGAFLPWMKAAAPLVGSLTVSGVDDGGDGVVMVLVAVLVAVLAWRLTTGNASWKAAFAAVILAGAAGLLLVYDVTELADRIEEANDLSEMIRTQYGAGIYLTGLGIVAAFVGAGLALFGVDDVPAQGSAHE